jgi:hypothetical protein
MGLLKKAVLEGVLNGICPDWFDVTDVEVGTPFIDGVSLILEICAKESTNLESIFVMRFSNGMVRKVSLRSVFISHFTQTKSSMILHSLHHVHYWTLFWRKAVQRQ